MTFKLRFTDIDFYEAGLDRKSKSALSLTTTQMTDAELKGVTPSVPVAK